MFDKIGNLGKLKAIRDSLRKENVKSEKRGVKVVMNGELEVVEVVLNNNLSKEENEKILKECFNDCLRKTKLMMAGKLQSIFG